MLAPWDRKRAASSRREGSAKLAIGGIQLYPVTGGIPSVYLSGMTKYNVDEAKVVLTRHVGWGLKLSPHQALRELEGELLECLAVDTGERDEILETLGRTRVELSYERGSFIAKIELQVGRFPDGDHVPTPGNLVHKREDALFVVSSIVGQHIRELVGRANKEREGAKS
jgi:hypothetical protein